MWYTTNVFYTMIIIRVVDIFTDKQHILFHMHSITLHSYDTLLLSNSNQCGGWQFIWERWFLWERQRTGGLEELWLFSAWLSVSVAVGIGRSVVTLWFLVWTGAVSTSGIASASLDTGWCVDSVVSTCLIFRCRIVWFWMIHVCTYCPSIM